MKRIQPFRHQTELEATWICCRCQETNAVDTPAYITDPPTDALCFPCYMQERREAGVKVRITQFPGYDNYVGLIGLLWEPYPQHFILRVLDRSYPARVHPFKTEWVDQSTPVTTEEDMANARAAARRAAIEAQEAERRAEAERQNALSAAQAEAAQRILEQTILQKGGGIQLQLTF